MDAIEFGKYIRSLRKDQGLTLMALGELSQVSHSHISNLENGSRGIPTPDILRKLAEPLGTTHSDLMTKAGHIDLEFENLMYGDDTATKIEDLRDIRKALLLAGAYYYGERILTKQDRDLIKRVLDALFYKEEE